MAYHQGAHSEYREDYDPKRKSCFCSQTSRPSRWPTLCNDSAQRLYEKIMAVCNTETFRFCAETRGDPAFTVTVQYSLGLVSGRPGGMLEVLERH